MLQEQQQQQQNNSENNGEKSSFSIVDVGSRLGIVPVAIQRYLTSRQQQHQPFSSSSVFGQHEQQEENNNKMNQNSIHAVELDKEYCSIQQKLFSWRNKRTSISNREQVPKIHLHNEDISSEKGISLLENANFVIMNNVFEFFASECEIELGLWEKTLHALKETPWG